MQLEFLILYWKTKFHEIMKKIDPRLVIFNWFREFGQFVFIPSAARLPKAAEPGRPKAARTTALGNWDDGNEQKFLKTTTDDDDDDHQK